MNISPDQTYLGARLWSDHDDPEFRVATVIALNQQFGISLVENCMRYLHGFPPPLAIHSLRGYLATMCRGDHLRGSG